MESLLTLYARIDAVASDILSDKQQITELDSKRNQNREAIRQLKAPSVEKKSWVCFDNTFLQLDSHRCLKMLEEDQNALNAEIDKLREGLKRKVAILHEMEGSKAMKGFNLKGMARSELWEVTNKN